MLSAIQTKLLAAVFALLLIIAGALTYQNHVLAEQRSAEAARQKAQADFQKRVEKYRKQDNTWKDGAKAMQEFRLP